MSARTKAYLALICCELLYGASQPIVKPVLEFITPSQFLFLRYLVAAPLVIPLIVRGLKQNHYSLRQWFRIIFIEAMSIGNLFLLYSGLSHISALQSSLILQARPIFVTIAGLIILNENIEKHEWIGLIISVAGTIIILTRPFFQHTDGFTSASFIGTAILLLSNLVYTTNTILIKKHYTKISKPMVSGIHMWIGLLMFGLYLIPTHRLPNPQLILSHPQIILATLYMAIFGSIISMTLSNYSLSKIEASEATLFLYLQPLVYIPLSVIWLNESLSSVQLLGMTLIFSGVWYASKRLSHRKHNLRHGLPLLQRLRLAMAEPELEKRHQPLHS